jgi:hypothetical protein
VGVAEQPGVLQVGAGVELPIIAELEEIGSVRRPPITVSVPTSTGIEQPRWSWRRLSFTR